MEGSMESLRLEAGRPVIREILGGASHTYFLRLQAGQYVRLAADQHGIDLVLKLFKPDGKDLMAEVDSPTGRKGSEKASEIAPETGDYQVQVVSDSTKARPGKYEVKIEELRPATDQDHKRVEAERVFRQGEKLRQEKQWGQALERYQQALGMWRSLGDQASEATTVYRIGWVQGGMGEHARALETFDQAMALYRAMKDADGEATVLNRRGTVLRDQGRLPEALASYREAVEIFRRLNDPHGLASSLNNSAIVLSDIDRNLEAIDAYYEAAKLFQQIDEPKREATTRINLAQLYVVQGRNREAQDALKSALRAAETFGDATLLAEALNNLGDLDHREGRLAEARSRLDRALEIVRKEGDERDKHREGDILASLGTALLKTGDLDGAWKAYEDALAIFRELKLSQGEAIALSNLARVHYAKGEDLEAVASQRTARTIFKQTGDHRGMAMTRFGSARSLARMGDLGSARLELEEGLETVELLRAQAPGSSFETSYFASKQHYWDLYVDILMQLHKLRPDAGFNSQALHAAERRRARGLLDALTENREVRESQVPAQWQSEVQEVQERLKLAELRRKDLLAAGAEARSLSEAEANIRSLLARLDVLRAKLEERPESEKIDETAPLNVPEIQRLLDPQTLLLSYSLGEQRSFLWAISHDEVTSYDLAMGSRIETAARLFLSSIWRPSQKDQTAKTSEILSGLVLAPAAERIRKFRRILVVSDGALQSVPFAALIDPSTAAGQTRLMIESHEIDYIPSASVLASLQHQKGRRSRKMGEKLRIAVIAAPDFGNHESTSNLTPLPYTQQEAKSIERLARKGKLFMALGSNATRELFTSGKLDGYHILHIATHGSVDSRQPELSGLAFSDGILRLYEIENLKLKANLVVLSACQTGTGLDVRGEGVQGMTRGFFSAGVPQLVVSLWNVDDRATAELMERFYEQLLDGHPASVALHLAQLSMLDEPQWSHPRYWAGFIFQGDFRRKPNGDDYEEEDSGGVVLKSKPESDLPPPAVAPDEGES